MASIVQQVLEYILKHGDAADVLGLIMSAVGSVVTGMVACGVKFLRDLTRSVDRLNDTMERVIDEQKEDRQKDAKRDERIMDLTARVRVVERLIEEEDSDDEQATSN